MKKLFAFLLAAAMAVTLFACGKATESTASSSGLGGTKLYILADRGEGQMYYKVLELHPEADFDGAEDVLDEKYAEFLLRCQLAEADFRNWTNAEAEEYLSGKSYRFERTCTAAQLAKFNELGLTSDKLHTLMNASFTVDEITAMTADQVQEMFDKGEWDGWNGD